MSRRRARLAVARLENRTNPSTLIPQSGVRDLAFDAARNRLYMTTSGGGVARYDAAGGTMLTGIPLGTSLNGADITPDGRYLYAAENQRGPTQGFFYKVDLAHPALASTLVPYNLNGGEGGAWDIAIGPSGVALTTGRYEGSGWVDSRLLNTATDTFTLAGRGVRQDSHLSRSADRTLVVVAESNSSAGPFETYRFGVGFSATFGSGQSLTNTRTAVSHDGGLIASEVGSATAVVSPTFDAVLTFAGFDGGMAFDPLRDVIYAVNSTTDELAAFDTVTGREKFRMPVGENVSASAGLGAGTMVVSADGSKVFLVTPAGVRRFDLPAANGVAARLQLSNVATFRAAGAAAAVTVTALDPAGNVVTNYAGTVNFTSTDPAAGLPAAYTFVPGDGGVKTFAVTWNTAGSRTLTAADAANGLAATTSAVTVHNTAAPLLPVPARRDLVFDDAHGLLLITTSAGTVERYDPAARSMLAPLTGGGSYNGADVTPDGSALVVADGQRSLTQSVLRRIDPLTGAATLIRHPGDGGAWDVALAANGTGLVDYRYEGSGWVTLDRIDVAAGTVANSGRSVRQNSNIHRGAGRNLFFLTESNISSGPIFTYNPATNTFPASADTSAFLDNNLAAVNRTGALIALEFGTGTTVMNPAFGTVRLLSGIDGGLAFDPVRDVLYGVNSATDQIVAFDTVTWAEKYRLPVGEDAPTSSAFSHGVMTVSGDGRWLFLSTSTGVRVYDVAPTLTVTAPAAVTTGVAATLTVTARNPDGTVDPTYRGAVTFASSDGTATLPAAYAFTAADGGVRTFTATLRAVGVRTVTATDDQASRPVQASVTVLPARVAGVQVNGGAAQRSRVTSLTVTFNTQVTFSDPGNVASAFRLTRIGGGDIGVFTATPTTVGGVTVVTLSGFAGAETAGGSLIDGRYTLRVLAGQVSAGGTALDGDGNGAAGGDFVTPPDTAVGGPGQRRLYRLYGDATGDGVVDLFDLAEFRSTFNLAAGNPAYKDYLDANGDGVIDLFDLADFRARFNTTVLP